MNEKAVFGIAVLGVAGALLLLTRKEEVEGPHAPGTKGTLVLDTLPTGASVYMKEGIGDYLYMGVTPITLTLKADTMYAFRLTKTGYADAYLPSGYAVENKKTATLTWPLTIGIGGPFTYGPVLVLPSSGESTPEGKFGQGINVSCSVSNPTAYVAQLNVTLAAQLYNPTTGTVISSYQETVVLNISPGGSQWYPYFNRYVLGGIMYGKVVFAEGEAVKVVISDEAGGRSEPGYWGDPAHWG